MSLAIMSFLAGRRKNGAVLSSAITNGQFVLNPTAPLIPVKSYIHFCPYALQAWFLVNFEIICTGVSSLYPPLSGIFAA